LAAARWERRKKGIYMYPVNSEYTKLDQVTNYTLQFVKSDHQSKILYPKPNNCYYCYGFLKIQCNICSCYNLNTHLALSINVMLRL
jgi:hypothetical protein